MHKYLLIILLFYLAGCHQFIIYSPDRVKAYTADINRPYKALGMVRAEYQPSISTRYVTYSTLPTIGGGETRSYLVHHELQISAVIRLLLDKAYDQYGNKLAAVIKVDYRVYPNPYRTTTRARGIAVCFTDEQGECIEYN